MPCSAFGQVFQHGELNVSQAWYAFHLKICFGFGGFGETCDVQVDTFNTVVV